VFGAGCMGPKFGCIMHEGEYLSQCELTRKDPLPSVRFKSDNEMVPDTAQRTTHDRITFLV
jgi:hypothetical protein